MSTNTFSPVDDTLQRIPEGPVLRDPWPADRPPMRLTTTVPKEFVHRAALAEVLLTGQRRIDDLRFGVTAQWPRSHSFYSPLQGTYHDPLLAAETIRQVGFLLPHTELGVPVGHQFLMHTFAMSVRPELLHVGHTPADLDIEVTFSDVRERRDTHTGARYDAVIHRDGEAVATGRITYTCIAPRAYRRLRGNQGHLQIPLTAPVPPQSVGRLSPTDVVLSPVGGDHRWQLRVDTRHPVLFDHPVDHVPGMLLTEAARQAATAVLGDPARLVPVEVESEYLRYVELDAPCFIQAVQTPEDLGSDRVRIIGEQGGEEMFRTTVTAVRL
ncbi:ScbA/BarX family gamma-butyrolactone biosynthesis protein [Streptomyces sp. G44]|uniref:ScbA/BarX family gamma-butyrolactone biosynthesis protein n=1 Tax=Streptomyces sp. G44 TaxID=2807632 RepID=UPI001EF7BF29|nr:ScbA/BarX family gamma-butyrolactone biosynthesis protein [Streptomyces sp. G44]